jgi:rhamnosyltransferase
VSGTDDLTAPRIAVLLAAYNGCQWLSAQLQSILGQQGVQVSVFVSVDKSSDGTEALVGEWASKDARVIPLPYGETLGGAAKNFYHLLRNVDFFSFDYVSFADQDDIWLADKLVCAHQKLSQSGFAAYSGNVTAFWPDGREQLLDKAQPQRQYDFLFEAAGPGCSYVLKVANALAFKAFLLQHWEEANKVFLHDWLMYAWFRANGLPWFIDANPKIRYRQHANNQVGANSGLKAFEARLALVRKGWYRAQIAQIVGLLGSAVATRGIGQDGSISKVFLIRNICQLRRRLRDRFFLFFIILLGVY